MSTVRNNLVAKNCQCVVGVFCVRRYNSVCHNSVEVAGSDFDRGTTSTNDTASRVVGLFTFRFEIHVND